jgi:general secretion pathway protein F
MKAALDDVAKALRDGAALPEALARRPDAFPDDYRALVKAGADSGRLPEVLRHVEGYHLLRERLRRGFLRFAVYVVTGLVLAAAVLSLVSIAGGQFGQVFEQIDIEMPAATAFVVWTGSRPAVAVSIAAGLVVAAAGALLFVRWLFNRTRIGYWVPAWGWIQRHRDLALLCTTLALRLEASAPMPESLAAAEAVIPNRYLRARLARVRARVSEGEALSTALFYERFFPRTLAWAVSLAEARDDVPSTFHLFGRLYATELARGFEVLLMVLTPLGVLIVGNGAILAIGSLFLPLISLMQGIGMAP